MRIIACAVVLLTVSCSSPDSSSIAAQPEADAQAEADAAAQLPPCGEACDRVCPGDSDCPGTGSSTLRVGFGEADITPAIKDTFTDQNGDGTWQEDEPTVDANQNGKFDPVWIAGYGTARPANGIHDAQLCRTIVVEQNGVKVALTSADVIGLFYNHVVRIREAVAASRPDIQLVIVAAAHNHEGPDTMGLWGPTETKTGIDQDYMSLLVDRCAASIADAADDLRPATLSYRSTEVRDDDGSMLAYVSDHRDPTVIDSTLTLLDFRALDGTRIATLANWAAHAESTGDANNLLSSDFIHYFRDAVENGLTRQGETWAGTGAPVVFFNGALGGQIGPGEVRPVQDDGTLLPDELIERGFETPEAIGHGVAAFALRALASEADATDAEPALSFRTKRLLIPVENSVYLMAFALGIFDRKATDYDPTKDIGPGNTPKLESEMAYVTLGRSSILTMPGELFPETYMGGYDGSACGTQPLVKADNPNPPQLDSAPKGPYLRDRMQGEYPMLFGLALDEVGYIVPAYDFKLDDTSPWFEEAPGDHYEETASVGAGLEPLLADTATNLMLWNR